MLHGARRRSIGLSSTSSSHPDTVDFRRPRATTVPNAASATRPSAPIGHSSAKQRRRVGARDRTRTGDSHVGKRIGPGGDAVAWALLPGEGRNAAASGGTEHGRRHPDGTPLKGSPAPRSTLTISLARQGLLGIPHRGPGARDSIARFTEKRKGGSRVLAGGRPFCRSKPSGLPDPLQTHRSPSFFHPGARSPW